ncbi:MAG: flagellar motor switch protein FliM [Pirellulaceae bacterium]|nr:flagellar motor switch protein FliM [Pirellulaceae bacterium]
MRQESLTTEERELLSSGMIQVDREPGNDCAKPVHDEPPRNPDLGDVQEQLDAIQSFHSDLARRFEDILSSGLQQLVDVQLQDVQAMTYSQFAFSRAKPTCFVILQATPLPSPLALDLSPPVLYPLLDCLLGGGKQPCSIPDRPPTELEQRLAGRITEMLLNELRDAWEALLAVNLTVDRMESNAQRVRLVSPSDPVIVLIFRTRVAEQTGDFTLCLPTQAIRKMVDKLLCGEYGIVAPDERQKEQAVKTSELVVKLAMEPLSAAEWSQVKVGDVVLTEVPADGMVDVLIDGEVRFSGRPGAIDGHRAVELRDR